MSAGAWRAGEAFFRVSAGSVRSTARQPTNRKRGFASAVTQWRADQSGASPLTVITAVVLLVAAITAVLVMTFVGRGPSVLSLQETQDGAAPAFEVTAVHGSLEWDGLAVQLLDPAGVDRAGLYLDVPDGGVEVGDVLHLRSRPPAGTYLLRVLDGEAELTRVALRL